MGPPILEIDGGPISRYFGPRCLGWTRARNKARAMGLEVGLRVRARARARAGARYRGGAQFHGGPKKS